LPSEAKRQLWEKLRQINLDVIARKEKALARTRGLVGRASPTCRPLSA
jgi:hypothetical protein